MLDRVAPLLEADGEEGLAEILLGGHGDAVVAVITALPAEDVPGLGFNVVETFPEVHLDGHIEGFIEILGEVLPSLGVVKLAAAAEGIDFGRDDAFGGQVFLVLVAVEGPAGFGRGEAAAFNHDAMLHVRRPGHGVVDHEALLAGLVPAVPDGLGGQDVGAEGLGGVLMIQRTAFMIVIVVLYAMGAGIGTRADGGPGRRRYSGQVEAFGDIAAFLDETTEVVEAAFLEKFLEAFRDETVETDESCALRFGCHGYFSFAVRHVGFIALLTLIQ